MFYSTDEAGAYLHHIARSYDDLADGTFFVHGHVHGGHDAAIRTMDWTAASGAAPQTYFFGTTRLGATRVPRSGGMPSALGVPVKDATRKPRGGNYRNGEFHASRLSIRRRPRSWFAQAFDIVDQDARCADVYNKILCQDCPRRTSSTTTARLRVRIPGNTGGGAIEGPAGPSGWKSSASGAPDNSSLNHFDGEQACDAAIQDERAVKF